MGAAIRKVREEKQPKLTIEALALAAGMDKGYLSDIERLKRNPSWDKLAPLVEALEIDLAALIREARTMPPDAKPETDESKA